MIDSIHFFTQRVEMFLFEMVKIDLPDCDRGME